MKKLFISQPMNGRSDAEIKEERQNILLQAVAECGEEIELIDSYFEDAPHDAKPLWFLGESLKMLSVADVVYFADGWEAARGCRIEHECAREYGLEIIND